MKNSARFMGTVAAIGLLLILVIGIGIGFYLDEPAKTKQQFEVARIDRADGDAKRDDRLLIGPVAQRVEDNVDELHEDIDDDLRGSDPTKAGVITGPLASQEWPGCTTAFVRNFSQRRTSVRAFAVHYTAGFNIVGLADMNGLTAYANNPRNEVSWHFLIDREGHCYYSVPLKYKAWTISGLNSETINVEMIGRGTEPDYGDLRGRRKLAQVYARVRTFYPSIQLRLGATDGRCHVTVTGWITHWMGGPCSGGHHDIRPYSLTQLISQMRAILTPPAILPGPSPKPAWFWSWCNWIIGEKEGTRPEEAPLPIPQWGWDACNRWIALH